MMAGVAIMNVFMSNCTTGEICYQLLIAILCIATIFCKKYRYIGLSIILVLMFIAYLVTKSSNPQLSSSASFLRLNVLSSLN